MTSPPPRPRPLSPHLQAYRPMLTMVMSIVHRLTGGALYFGTLLLAWWLIAVASGPAAYAVFSDAARSVPGVVVLVGYTWALLHHMLGGIKHLVWDTGRGFGLAAIEVVTRVHLAGSVCLTALLWIWVWTP